MKAGAASASSLELLALRDTLSAASTIARINFCKWVGAARIQERTGAGVPPLEFVSEFQG
jgi:hypothetical protein